MSSDEGLLHRSLAVQERSPLQLLDPLLVALALWIACRVHDAPWHEGMVAAAATGVASFALLAERSGIYRSWRGGGLGRELKEVLGVWSGTVLALLLLAFATGSSAAYSRAVLLGWWLLTPLLFAGLRLVSRMSARALRRCGYNRKRAAIVGSGMIAGRVAETMASRPWMGFELVGCFDVGTHTEGGPTAPLEELERLVRDGEVDTVYVATAMGEDSEAAELVRRLTATHAAVFFVPDLAPFALSRARWTSFGSLPAVSLFESPLTDLERLSKRVEDLMLGSAAFALALIPMLLIAAAIRLTSPGPVFYRQRRHGLDGKGIWVHKFRTMYVCESDDEFQQVRRQDPRVTPLGRILRVTSLDELPQLFDVLRGDMSLVGPRPHPVPLNERFADSIDWFQLRHRMKPGMTGWAQINGLRGETDTEAKMRGRVEHDLEYIRNWSLWLDLKILALTPLRGLSGDGSY